MWLTMNSWASPRRWESSRAYSDVLPINMVIGYTLVEVGAEKLRCVMQRVQARDHYDLYRLFVVEGESVDGSWASFLDKARHKGLDPEIFAVKLGERRRLYADRWAGELGGYLHEVPPFEKVDRAVRGAIRSAQ